MATLLAVLVDVTAVLTVALVATLALRRRSAALRHAVLATAIVCALLMPAFELLLPPLPVIQPGEPTSAFSSGSTLISADATSATGTEDSGGLPHGGVPWATLLAGVWLAGVVVTVAGLLTGLVRLARLKARCEPMTGPWRALTDELAAECGVARHVPLLQSTDPAILVTCGVLNPVIILPAGAADWTDERQRIVLRHELGHVRRHDAALQLAGEVLRVVQPINPLVWLACRRLRQESEHACDDAVLGGGVAATEYATQLLGIAKHLSGRHTAWASAPAIAHPSTLERRVVAMLDTHRNRQPLTRRGWALAALIALAVSLPVAAAGVAPVMPVPVVTRSAEPSTAAPAMIPVVVPPAPTVVRRQLGAVAGRIVDQTGGVIPGATVTLTDLATGAELATYTNASGRFSFSGVNPAQHRLAVSLPGFTSVSTVLTLKPGTTLDRTITLSIGSLAETITVSCTAQPLLGPLVRAFFPTLSAQEPMAPIRVGGSVRPPRKIKDVRPACPAGVVTRDSTVRLTARIGQDGLVYDAAPIPADASAAAPADLIDASLFAVRQWQFTPTQLNGQTIDVTMTVTIQFKTQ